MINIEDILAVDRAKLANQRTLLAYIRTSFYFIGLSLTVIGIESFEKLKFLAVPLLIISPTIILIGTISYFREKQKIERMKITLQENR